MERMKAAMKSVNINKSTIVEQPVITYYIPIDPFLWLPLLLNGLSCLYYFLYMFDFIHTVIIFHKFIAVNSSIISNH